MHNARILAEAGLPGPDPVGPARGRFVAWRRSPGKPGPLLLGGPEGSRLAYEMGRLARALGQLSSSSLTVDSAWGTAADLRRAASGWLDRLVAQEPEIHARRDAIRLCVERVCRASWSPRPTHGDFVPANVLVRAGRIEALLDVTELALRHPEVDLAWWELVVGFHHPADVARLARSFRRGHALGGNDMDVQRLRDLAVVRALQLVPPDGTSGRTHAVALLCAASDAHGM